jgi:hypothetical protein
VYEDPKLRLRHHRLHIHPHRTTARHAGAQHFVIEVQVDDAELTFPQGFEGGMTYRRLGIAAVYPSDDDLSLPVDNGLAAVRAKIEPRVSTTVAIAHGSPWSRSRIKRPRISCMARCSVREGPFGDPTPAE